MRLRKLLVGVGIVVLVALALVAVGLFHVASSLPSGEHPDIDFHDAEIAAARAAMVPKLEAQLVAVERRFGAEHVGPRGRVDRCEAGFDDFTRQDAHAYLCRMEIVQVIPMREPFKANAARLGEALLEGDCPDGTDTDRALAEPFDDPQELNQTSGDCTQGYYDPAPVINGWLPMASTAEELERATSDLPLSCYPWHERRLCEETSLDLGAAAAAAPPGTAYLAIVTAGEFEFYYEVDWE